MSRCPSAPVFWCPGARVPQCLGVPLPRCRVPGAVPSCAPTHPPAGRAARRRIRIAWQTWDWANLKTRCRHVADTLQTLPWQNGMPLCVGLPPEIRLFPPTHFVLREKVLQSPRPNFPCYVKNPPAGEGNAACNHRSASFVNARGPVAKWCALRGPVAKWCDLRDPVAKWCD